MKRVLCALVASLSLASVTMATAAKPQKKASFEIKGGNFLYNGKPIQIHSGEMHYARIPHEYWRHRLKMLKAMGLNTVATYVFWNLHEVEPDKWDFSGDKDLATSSRLLAKRVYTSSCALAHILVPSGSLVVILGGCRQSRA